MRKGFRTKNQIKQTYFKTVFCDKVKNMKFTKKAGIFPLLISCFFINSLDIAPSTSEVEAELKIDQAIAQINYNLIDDVNFFLEELEKFSNTQSNQDPKIKEVLFYIIEGLLYYPNYRKNLFKILIAICDGPWEEILLNLSSESSKKSLDQHIKQIVQVTLELLLATKLETRDVIEFSDLISQLLKQNVQEKEKTLIINKLQKNEISKKLFNILADFTQKKITIEDIKTNYELQEYVIHIMQAFIMDPNSIEKLRIKLGLNPKDLVMVQAMHGIFKHMIEPNSAEDIFRQLKINVKQKREQYYSNYMLALGGLLKKEQNNRQNGALFKEITTKAQEDEIDELSNLVNNKFYKLMLFLISNKPRKIKFLTEMLKNSQITDIEITNFRMIAGALATVSTNISTNWHLTMMKDIAKFFALTKKQKGNVSITEDQISEVFLSVLTDRLVWILEKKFSEQEKKDFKNTFKKLSAAINLNQETEAKNEMYKTKIFQAVISEIAAISKQTIPKMKEQELVIFFNTLETKQLKETKTNLLARLNKNGYDTKTLEILFNLASLVSLNFDDSLIEKKENFTIEQIFKEIRKQIVNKIRMNTEKLKKMKVNRKSII